MPDKLLLTLFTPTRLRGREALGRLLDALEGNARATPTHWGMDERAREPYDRGALLDAVTTAKARVLTPGLARRKAPKWDGYFSVQTGGLNYVKLEFGALTSEADLQLAYGLGGAIAQATATEFGIVHPMWKLGDRAQRYAASGLLRPSNFAECGPRALCARTWLGPRLAALLPAARLSACGCTVRETSWGGVEVDLVADPWRADFETLDARQVEVMACVEETGMFGAYASGTECTAGARWAPIPVPDAP